MNLSVCQQLLVRWCVCLLIVASVGTMAVPAHAYIDNGANAIDGLGQNDDSLSAPSPVYTKFAANDGPNKLGFSSPSHIQIDTVHHRLFVSDAANNRVLIYNLNTDNTFPDRIPDNVLGQQNLYSNVATTSQAGMNVPEGLVYDSSGDRLFVAGYTSNRVTVYDVSSITDGENAVNVLGQTTFSGLGTANTQAGMNGPFALAYDSGGSRLFMADYNNSRVMVYNVSSITNGQNAVNVLGQVNFTAWGGANTQARMFYASGLAYDSSGSRLFVAGYGNNRVTVYDVSSITDGENAVNVLGQANFTAFAAVNTQAGMNGPYGLTYDSSGNRLFVAGFTNNRVTVYDVSSITDGENAVNVLGQVNFTAFAAANTQAGMNRPRGLDYDSGGNRLFVVGYTNHRVTVYNVSSITNGQNAVDLLGQYDDSLSAPSPVYTRYTVHNGPNKLGLYNPSHIALDNTNHRLFLSEWGNNRVLVYNLNTDNSFPDRIPDNVLGQPDFYSNVAAWTQAGMYGPRGLAYDSSASRLFVANYNDNRVTVYNVSSITNGQNAVNVLGQANFTVNSAANTQVGMSQPYGLAFDSTNNRLFVASYAGNRIIIYDVSSITNGENAVDLLGQYDNSLSDPQPIFTKGASYNAPNRLGLNTVYDAKLDAVHHRLFVADAGNHRVLVYNLNTDNTFSDRIPDNVLGQANFYSNTAANTQAGMNAPYGLAYDSSGNRLFVAGATNNRVTVYNVSSITDGENAVNVLGQVNFTAFAAANTQAGMNSPRALVYDSSGNRLFVTGYTNNRVTVYNVSSITDGQNAVNVLGQVNFTAFAAANTQAGMYNPSGLAYNSGGSKLYVSGYSNNRITVYDVSSITNGANAVDVLGQVNFTGYSGSAGTQEKLSSPTGLDYDSGGNRLFVSAGARVAIFDTTVTVFGRNAKDALGQYNDSLSDPQPIFTKSLANDAPNRLGLIDPQAVEIDTVNHKLFVADSSNNRVLIYNLNADNTLPDRIPDYVLGQSNFYTNSTGTSQAGLYYPYGLACDSARMRLFIADYTNNRVVLHNISSIVNGQNASFVLGQATFTSSTAANTQAGMYNPYGVAYDSIQDRLYVPGFTNHRVTTYDVAPNPNNQNAVDLLGQYDNSLSDPQPIYTKAAAHNAPNRLGLNYPSYVALDGTNHRLFVTDATNNRILIYNLNTDNTFPDRIPDNVLGQPNFYSNTSAASQVGMSTPYGLAYDSSGNRLFVADSTNNRVTVYNVSSITDGENAVNVLGQLNFTAASSATTQPGVNRPHGLAYDSSGNRLFVADNTNNRVTVYNVSSITDGQNAVNVLGQANFTVGTAANTQAGMNAPGGLAYDSSGNRLFVGGINNARVTVYDVSSITDGENAVNVLGQVNFTAFAAANTQAGMNGPYGLAYDSAGNRLFVALNLSNRVTVYDVSSITDGENAVNVLGQVNFTEFAAATTQAGMSGPRGLAYDSAGNRLIVVGGNNYRVTVYDVSSITDGENAVDLLGQNDNSLIDPHPVFTKATAHDAPNRLGLNGPTAVAIDASNHRLFVSDLSNSRVLVYNLNTDNTFPDRIPDNVIGQPNFYSNAGSTSQAGLNSPYGLAYDGTQNRLFVSSDHRITVYNVSSITDGQNAVNVLGQVNFTGSAGGVTQAGLSGPRHLAFDSNGSRLFVANYTGNRVTVYDVSSITNGQNALNVLGQTNFTTSTAANTQAGMSGPMGLAYDSSGNRLFVAAYTNHRVTVYDVSSITNGQNALNVLGQTNFTAFAAANTQTGMNNPISLAYDSSGNRLFVAGYTNNRVTVYDASTITDGENASIVLGQTNFTGYSAASTQTGLSGPYGLAYDAVSGRLFTVENTGHRVKVFSMGTSTTPPAKKDHMFWFEGF